MKVKICWNCYTKHTKVGNFCTPECKKDYLGNIYRKALKAQKELKNES